MPRVVFINEGAVLIECEYVPPMGANQEAAAELASTQYCMRCGFARDADLRNQELYNSSGGTKQFRILCFSPKSPYLAEMKKQLEQQK